MQEANNETDNKMFTVTPIEDNDLSQFGEKALEEGYAAIIVEQAVKVAASKNIQTYTEFERVIDSVMNNMEVEQAEDKAKEERIKRSTKMEVSRLCKISNIAEYADTCIYNTYRTHSVSIMDILRMAPEEQLGLDVYQEPIYSVIIQISKPWVSDIVHNVMESWSTKEYPRKFVEEYLESIGVPEEEFETRKAGLLEYLSDDYVNDAAPIEYKHFKAVQQILQQSRTDYAKTEQAILSNQDSLTEYGATLELEMENGMPAEAASASATEAASELIDDSGYDDIDEEEESTPQSLSSKAGAFCGKVLRFKYQTAKSFEDMMYESMGEFAPEYKENRSAIRERKEELRKQKADYKLKQQEAQIEIEKQQAIVAANKELMEHDRYVSDDSYRNNRKPRRSDYELDRYERDDRRGRNQYREDGRYYAGRTSNKKNLGADRMPAWLIVLLVNLFSGLVLWLILEKFYATVAVAGLIGAFAGIITMKQKQRDGVVITLVGYLAVLLAIYLNFKVR